MFIIFFIAVFSAEIILFLFINKERHIKLISFILICSKGIYLILGLFNTLIYLITTLVLFIYVYFLHLKFKYYKIYDSIQFINYIFLFVYAIFTSILIYHNLIIFIILISLIFFSILRWPTYIINKRNALKFRENAIEAFDNKKYSEAELLYVKGIEFASKMIYIPHSSRHLASDLQKLMEKEKLMIQKYINEDYLNQKNVLDEINDNFIIPKISVRDLRKYMIRLFLLFVFLLPVVFLILLL